MRLQPDDAGKSGGAAEVSKEEVIISHISLSFLDHRDVRGSV